MRIVLSKNIAKNQKGILITILIVAFAIRLAAVFLFAVPVEKDAWEYDQIATHILENGQFAIYEGVPTSHRAPLYPIFLSAVYLVFGHSHQAARVAQAFLSAAVCLLAYLVAKSIYGTLVGLLSALLVAFHQSLLMITMLYSEALFALLLVVMILFFITAVVQKKSTFFFLTGIFIGLSSLTRPTMLLFPICALVVLLVVFKGSKMALIRFAVLTGATLIVVTPWMVRNYFLKDSLVPISSQGSHVFSGTYSKIMAKKEWRTIFDMELLEEQRARPVGEKIRERIKLENPDGAPEVTRQMIMKAIWDHPLEYLKVVGIRVGIFWLSPPMGTSALRAKSEILGIAWIGLKYLLLLFAILGVFRSMDKWTVILPILVLLLYMTAVHGLIHSIRRYNLPLIPFVLIFSARGMIVGWNTIRDRYFLKPA